MAIKLQTETTAIPVEIGKLKFEFDVSDESVVNFRKKASDLQGELDGIEQSDDEDKVLEQMKDVLGRGYDLMLGEGAFNKIYKQTPSVVKLLGYFVQLSEEIEKELNDLGMTESQQEKMQKYLKNKKKK